MAVYEEDYAYLYLHNILSVLGDSCNTIQHITDQQLNLQLEDLVFNTDIILEIKYTFINIKTKERKIEPSLNPITASFVACKLAEVYTEKLNHVLEKHCHAQKDLKSKEKISEKTQSLLDLKIELDHFLVLISKVIEYYNLKFVGLNVNKEILPSQDELQQQKEHIFALMNELQLFELHKIFVGYKGEFMVSDATIICSLLGLNEDYQIYLDTLKNKGEDHREELYFIMKMLEAKEQELEYDSNNKGAAGLYKNLVCLGFTQTRAESIAKCIAAELIDRQKPSYWAERFLTNVWAHHPLLGNNSRYPFSQQIKNDWFEEVISTEDRDEPNENVASLQIKMRNCTSESSLTEVKSYIKDVQRMDKDCILLYHGTTHAGAESIITSGITLEEGQKGQDFSSGDGFYLSETFEDADKWSGAARGEPKAIVVFKVQKELLDPIKENGLDLTEDPEKWQSVVKLCRNHYKDKKAKAKLLNDVSFIRGYTCLNPMDFAKGESNAEGFGQSEIQICIRDEDYSVKFGSLTNICGVIFY